MTKDDLMVVIGPTASGKTSLAIEMAKKYDGEIVSCDSMQIYKGLPISTAQPTEEEKEGVVHHLIGFVDVRDNFSVGEYQRLAREKIADIQSRGKLPILCGGTGLYIDSVIYHMDFAKVSEDKSIRKKYTKYYDENGAEALYSLLNEKAPDLAKRIHQNNVNRVIRALEVFDLTGEAKKEYYNETMKQLFYKNTIIVGTMWDRKELYERINKRVDIMLQNGLIDEIKAILSYGIKPENTAYKAIGCKELSEYFNGKMALDEAIDKIKQYSRNYAKRQITWFKRLNDVFWLNYSNSEDINNKKAIVFSEIENIYF
ncbi:MAG: tRNA (adenosine(37)-N6)-dimethylallyltransferase MiaA [Eubacteriales bacterium]